MSQAGSFNKSGGGGGSEVLTLTGNTGGPVTPDINGNINVPGSHGINSTGTTNTITFAIDNAITLGDLSAITAGSNALTATTGDIGVAAGNIKLPATSSTAGQILVNGSRFMHNWDTGTYLGVNAGNFVSTGDNNTGIGSSVLVNSTSGTNNTGVGRNSLVLLSTGSFNTAIGSGAMGSAPITGSNNTSIGYGSASNISTGSQNCCFGASTSVFVSTGSNNCSFGYNARPGGTGSYNVCIGSQAGFSLPNNFSNNILINSAGVSGDNNKLRIGNGTGTGNQQVDAAFISGIQGVNVGNVASVVSISGDQLGSATLTAGSNITITPTANAITISAAADLDYNYTTVNASPYVVLSTDQFISINLTTIGGAATVQLPDAPATGRTFTIKDKVGLAATSNITVTTVSGAITIDGATTFVMNTNYQAINVIFGSAGYEVY